MAKDTVHRVTLTNRGGVVVECVGNETIYEACQRAGIQLPIACEYGGCITCACILKDGKVRQPGATAINKRQNRAGYILPCVARPKTDCTVEVGVESHQTLYANPFAKTVTRQF